MRYVNKTTMNGKTCRDFLELCWPINASGFRIVLLAVGLFSLVWGFFQLSMYGMTELPYALGIFLMGIVAIFLGQWGWVFRLKNYRKAQYQLWGAQTLQKDVLFFEGEFVQRSALGEMTFYYQAVDGLYANHASLLIRMGPNAILLDRKGFTVGREKEFILFIKGIIKENKKERKKSRQDK